MELHFENLDPNKPKRLQLSVKGVKLNVITDDDSTQTVVNEDGSVSFCLGENPRVPTNSGWGYNWSNDYGSPN